MLRDLPSSEVIERDKQIILNSTQTIIGISPLLAIFTFILAVLNAKKQASIKKKKAAKKFKGVRIEKKLGKKASKKKR